MTEHKVKCLTHYFNAIASGEKPFEVRRDDRGYQKGDILVLQCFDGKYYEIDYTALSHTPKEVRRRITYVLTGGQFGIMPGYVVLGLEPET